MAFGVETDGFNRKTFADLVASVQARARVLFGAPNLDITEPDGLLANVYLPLLEELDEAWQVLEITYYILDPARSTRQSFAAVAALRGVARKLATVGTHPGASMVFDDAVSGTIDRGDIRFNVEGQPDNIWINSEDFVIGSAGTYAVAAESELAGSDKILSNGATIEIIEGPAQLTGITVTNDATPGTDLEDEVLWRLRADAVINEEQTTVGAALDELSTVNGARVVETAGYIRCIINDGGATPNNTIAQTILDNKAQGVLTLGSLSGTATDEEGETVTIYFDRVTERTLYVNVTPVSVAGYSPTALKNAIIGAVPITAGATLKWSALYTAALGVTGVDDITSLTVGTTVSPTGTSNLTPEVDEVFVLTAINITIV